MYIRTRYGREGESRTEGKERREISRGGKKRGWRDGDGGADGDKTACLEPASSTADGTGLADALGTALLACNGGLESGLRSTKRYGGAAKDRSGLRRIIKNSNKGN